MKNKALIYCSFIVTALLMTGCSFGRTNVTHPSSSDTQESAAPGAGISTTNRTSENASKETDPDNSMITEAAAKEIALAHADLVVEEVTFSKCELDRETEGYQYDIKFHTEDRLEYEYEIDAYTGKIISYEWDEDELFLE